MRAAIPMLFLSEVQLVSLRWRWLHRLPRFRLLLLLVCLAVRVLALVVLGNRVACACILWLLVNTHACRLEKLGAPSTCDVKPGNLGFVQEHLGWLLDHVVEGH